MSKKNVFQQLELFARGNPDALRRWYEDGADGLINWGTEGDLTRCHEKAMEYMDSEQAWGFCERRAEAVYGESNRSHDIAAGQYPKSSASTENVTELSEEASDESSVTLGNNADLKTKGEHQQKRKCSQCGKGYLGQKNSDTCGDACRQRKSRKG